MISSNTKIFCLSKNITRHYSFSLILFFLFTSLIQSGIQYINLYQTAPYVFFFIVNFLTFHQQKIEFFSNSLWSLVFTLCAIYNPGHISLGLHGPTSFPGVIDLAVPFFPSMPCSIITPGSVTPKYPNIRDITISHVVDPFCVGR